MQKKLVQNKRDIKAVFELVIESLAIPLNRIPYYKDFRLGLCILKALLVLDICVFKMGTICISCDFLKLILSSCSVISPQTSYQNILSTSYLFFYKENAFKISDIPLVLVFTNCPNTLYFVKQTYKSTFCWIWHWNKASLNPK